MMKNDNNDRAYEVHELDFDDEEWQSTFAK
jgi:hypothetical protein